MSQINIAKELSQAFRGDKASVKFLEDASLNQYPHLLLQLSQTVIQHQDRDIKRLAALYLKNMLGVDDKVRRTKREKAALWLKLSDQQRQEIRSYLLTALAVTGPSRHQAAQVVSSIAILEIPTGKWPGAISLLATNLRPASQGEEPKSPYLQETSLITISFILEEFKLQASRLSAEMESVMNAFYAAINLAKSNPTAPESVAITVAAFRCLGQALYFIVPKVNSDPAFRTQLFDTIISYSVPPHNPDVRLMAIECLSRLPTIYYEHFQSITQKILDLTTKTIHNENNRSIVMGVIEIWSVLAEYEYTIIEELKILQAIRQGDPNQNEDAPVYHQLVQRTAQYTIPLLLQIMPKQQSEYENRDQQSWNPSMTAGKCLELSADVAGNVVLGPVVDYFKKNYNSPHWQLRETAINAIGSILSGPTGEPATAFINRATDAASSMVSDKSIAVRDTATWTLAKIFQVAYPIIDQLNNSKFLPIVQTLVSKVKDEPRVVIHAGWGIQALFKGCASLDRTGVATRLVPHYPNIMGALFDVLGDYSTFKTSDHIGSLHEALNSAIVHCPPHMEQDVVVRAFDVFIQRLDLIARQPPPQTKTEKTIRIDILALLIDSITDCARTLHSFHNQKNAATRIGNTGLDVHPALIEKAQQLFFLFQYILENIPNDIIFEQVMFAVGGLITSIGPSADRFLSPFLKYFGKALSTPDAPDTVFTGLLATGEVARALKDKFANYADNFMTALVKLAQYPDLEDRAKAHVIGCIGDIALGLSKNFAKYLLPPFSIFDNLIWNAAAITCDPRNSSQTYKDYIMELRNNICNSLVSVISTIGYKHGDLTVITQNLPKVCKYIVSVATDRLTTDSAVISLTTLIVDLLIIFRGNQNVYQELNVPPVHSMVLRCGTIDNDTARELFIICRQQLPIK